MPLALVVLAKPAPVKPALLLSTVPSTLQKPVVFSCTVSVVPPPELEELELEDELVEPVVEELELELLELELLELEELDDELLLLELGAPLDEDELELLLDEVLELDELVELELDELELLLDDDEELVELEEELPVPLGIEHSLMPPGTRVPAPKVASLHVKLPLNIINVNWSERPKATFVSAVTVQAGLLVAQIVT
jgi:hypothetical protein